MVTKGRELDAKLKELEAQAEVSEAQNPNATLALLSGLAENSCYSNQKQYWSACCKSSFRGGCLQYNLFSLTVYVQVQTTKREMKATSAEIEENRAALASFLAGMRVQVASKSRLLFLNLPSSMD